MAPQPRFKENVEDNKMDLSMSGFTEVPVKDIAAIKKATSLDLSNNQITLLPPAFCSLTHLIELDLSKNLLRELPDSFGSLVNLKRLDLYGNQLTHLPLSFCHLKNLRWLDLKNNPLVPMLEEIAGPCGDTQQCQQCARNVVAALTKTAMKVEEDRKRLLEGKLREQEQIELELLLKKKEMDAENHKKSKKKAKKGKADKQALETNSETATSEKHPLEGREQKLVHKNIAKGSHFSLAGFFKSILKIIFHLILVLGTVMALLFASCVVLAMYDRKLYFQIADISHMISSELSDFVIHCAKHVEHAAKHPFLKEM